MPSSSGYGRRDLVEAQQLLADAEDVAVDELLLVVELDEDAVERAGVAHHQAGGVEHELGVARREVAVGVEERAEAAADHVLALVERVRCRLRCRRGG